MKIRLWMDKTAVYLLRSCRPNMGISIYFPSRQHSRWWRGCILSYWSSSHVHCSHRHHPHVGSVECNIQSSRIPWCCHLKLKLGFYRQQRHGGGGLESYLLYNSRIPQNEALEMIPTVFLHGCFPAFLMRRKTSKHPSRIVLKAPPFSHHKPRNAFQSNHLPGPSLAAGVCVCVTQLMTTPASLFPKLLSEMMVTSNFGQWRLTTTTGLSVTWSRCNQSRDSPNLPLFHTC